MTLTFKDALETSAILAEKLASAHDDESRADIERRKEAVNFVAFGLFKQAAAPGQAMEWLSDLRKPVAWGVGLGLPAYGVGHALLRDANHQGKDLIRDARNQALLTAAGVGGLQSLGGMAQRMMAGHGQSGDSVGMPDDATRLAAAIFLDDVLEQRLNEGDADEKVAAEACLRINRVYGAGLLRKLIDA